MTHAGIQTAGSSTPAVWEGAGGAANGSNNCWQRRKVNSCTGVRICREWPTVEGKVEGKEKEKEEPVPGQAVHQL